MLFQKVFQQIFQQVFQEVFLSCESRPMTYQLMIDTSIPAQVKYVYNSYILNRVMNDQYLNEFTSLICDKFQIIGKGSYGLVIRARWKGRDVAIKVFQTEAERSAFKVGDQAIRVLFILEVKCLPLKQVGM